MKIVIDARMMGAQKTRGIGRYIHEMTKQMALLLEKEERMNVVSPQVKWYGLREQWQMPFELKREKPDIVWIPHWNVSLFQPKPFVMTVHDLLLMHQPASAQATTRGVLQAWMKRMGYRLVLNVGLRRAAKILVPTQAVADDLIQSFPFTINKICITGEGLTELPKPHTQSRYVREKFLLYVGSAYPHKSLNLLMDVWQEMAKQHPELVLVIAGKEDVFVNKIKRSVEQNRIPRVLFIGEVDDQELATLYANAEAFVFPSQFEGFGLPPVEALAQGTPVIASDIQVLREVLPKEGVFFFKAGEKDDMIRAIETVLTDRSKAVQEAEIGASKVRNVHRWNKAAAIALTAIRSAVHHH